MSTADIADRIAEQLSNTPGDYKADPPILADERAVIFNIVDRDSETYVATITVTVTEA